jgi:hypothetical protein
LVGNKIKEKMKTKLICLAVCTLFIACSSQSLNVAEIKEGKWLNYACNGCTYQYFAVFAIPDKHWKILYQDTVNIYIGKVKNKNIFSKTKTVNDFYEIPLTEMERDIPLYKKENISKILTDSLNAYFQRNSASFGIYSKPTSADIITRGDSINYQIETFVYWFHFEIGEQKGKSLVITNKEFHVLEDFTLTR